MESVLRGSSLLRPWLKKLPAQGKGYEDTMWRSIRVWRITLCVCVYVCMHSLVRFTRTQSLHPYTFGRCNPRAAKWGKRECKAEKSGKWKVVHFWAGYSLRSNSWLLGHSGYSQREHMEICASGEEERAIYVDSFPFLVSHWPKFTKQCSTSGSCYLASLGSSWGSWNLQVSTWIGLGFRSFRGLALSLKNTLNQPAKVGDEQMMVTTKALITCMVFAGATPRRK